MNRSGVVAADGGEAAERSAPESLADLAYRRLEEAIVTLSLRPGAILNEAQMIALVDLGRTPVREALIRLAHQGLVEILPRKGIAITDIDAIDVMAALDAREVLERLIVSEAARRAGPGERIA
ncbi:MAG: GntR family transcriptional regulator, partial [Bosea sp.]|nr:GntR family transcriptional regulator [Bosea sp. (in: a-proteobacteria)]